MKIGIYAAPLGFENIDGYLTNLQWNKMHLLFGSNTGNMAFKSAIESQVDGDIIHYRWGSDPKTISKEVDIIILPAANQLGPHGDFGSFANAIEKLDIPLVVIGLGAQAQNFNKDITLLDGTKRWLDALLENGSRFGISNIYTRGPYTSAQIKHLTGGNSVVGGCPSHFLNSNPKLGEMITKNFGRLKQAKPYNLSVAAALATKNETIRKIEKHLINLLNHYDNPDGKYIVQSGVEAIKIAFGLDSEVPEDKIKDFKDFVMPKSSKAAFESWRIKKVLAYRSLESWLEDLSRTTFTIGMRYHGVALALQAGQLGCVISIDSRTEEMCNQTGVPTIKAKDYNTNQNTDELLKSINFDPIAYDKLRAERARNYVKFLKGCNLKPKKYLLELAN
jgi:hypothetical protein